MGGVDDELDCRGVPGVTVELLDADDVVFAAEVTNAAGNFFVRAEPGSSFQTFRVRLHWEGRTREMLGHVGSGDCNSCHTPTGANDAPGRIVAP